MTTKRTKEDRERLLARNEAGESFAALAREAGITGSRMAAICSQAFRERQRASEPPDPLGELSARTKHCLWAEGWRTAEEVRAAYNAGNLRKPGTTPNLGIVGLREVWAWLGVTEHQQAGRSRAQSEIARLREECERLLAGYREIAAASDTEMGDGDLARDIAARMLGA